MEEDFRDRGAGLLRAETAVQHPGDRARQESGVKLSQRLRGQSGPERALVDDPALAGSVLRMRRMFLGGLTPRVLARSEPLIRELQRIGAAHGVSASVVAVSWVISYYGDTVVAIPGASDPAHARDNAAAMDVRLGEAELARLAEVSDVSGVSPQR